MWLIPYVDTDYKVRESLVLTQTGKPFTGVEQVAKQKMGFDLTPKGKKDCDG